MPCVPVAMRQLLERLRAIAVVAVVERVHRRQVLRALAEDVPEHRQPIGVAIRQRLEQTPFTMLKREVLAPTPTASVATAMRKRALRRASERKANRKSWIIATNPTRQCRPSASGTWQSSYGSIGITIQRMR